MIEAILGSTETINWLGGLGFFAVILITAVVLFVYFKQIKDHKGGGELEDGEWDGIKEYKNPVPVGWTAIFSLLLIWAIWYWMFGYPLDSYSQIAEYNKETREYQSQFEKKWQNPSEATLVAMGKSVFSANCAQCHGNAADGNGGRAFDLRSKYVGTGVDSGNIPAIVAFAQYGTKGAIGTMPAFNSVGTLTDLQYQAVATYIVSNKLKEQK
ncbi:hypothetical protein AGMMS50229_05060 [Campylobacterota bacterium]|nr:hypothetical protein AGMMS50229_05060 [Campylobacterota bacterium]